MNNILIPLFGIIMLVFAFLDHRSYIKDNHKDFKSIIVSTGVLGTFLGIFIGLIHFDTVNIDKSVPTLLEGLKLAFATSIFGMFLSITLGAIQKRGKEDLESELGTLTSINSKVNSLEDIKIGINELIEQIKNFRMEMRDEQLKLRRFVEDQFGQTNATLNKALDELAKGATEEIVTALKDVITDFNRNLTEQFGENFKELNGAVYKLVEWQDKYKSHIETTEGLLNATVTSIENSAKTLDEIAQRNDEVQIVYEKLGEIIETYDTLVQSLKEQLNQFIEMGKEAKLLYSTIIGSQREIDSQLSDITQKIQSGLSEQSKELSTLTAEIGRKLPESLGELERTLVGLTDRFKDDYSAFLNRFNELLPK